MEVVVAMVAEVIMRKTSPSEGWTGREIPSGMERKFFDRVLSPKKMMGGVFKTKGDFYVRNLKVFLFQALIDIIVLRS